MFLQHKSIPIVFVWVCFVVWVFLVLRFFFVKQSVLKKGLLRTLLRTSAYFHFEKIYFSLIFFHLFLLFFNSLGNFTGEIEKITENNKPHKTASSLLEYQINT